MIKWFWTWDNEKELDLEIDNIDNEFEEEWQLALDIVETEEEISIIAPIAWVDLSDIDISLNSNVLTISWNRRKPQEVYKAWVIIRSDECFWGVFSRNIILPENLDLDTIRAILEKNILIIRIPKLRFSSQTIKIDRIED